MKLHHRIAAAIILFSALLIFALAAGTNIGTDIGTFVFNITH